MMGLLWHLQYYAFQSDFLILFIGNRIIMGFHGVNLLRFSIKVDVISILGFYDGAGLLVFVRPLRGVHFRARLK